MKRHHAISRILTQAEGSLFIHANGMISREAFSQGDRDENFYMIGSMGLASSIGLGVAMSQPKHRIVVVDGDGNVLTNMGAFAMVAHYQPTNFIHIVLDNGTYASTGGQRTISDCVSLEKIAGAAGYKQARRCTQDDELCECFEAFLSTDGPSFILVKVESGNVAGIARVSHTPQEIRQRFSNAIAQETRAEYSDDRSQLVKATG